MSAVVAYARSLVGKARWRHRGRKPWAVDCVGLVVLSLRAGGKPVQDATRYGQEPWDDQLRATLRTQYGEPVSDPRAGDIAVVQTGRISDPYHVGILGDHPDGGLTLIHARPINGVVEHSIRSVSIVEVYRPA